METSAEDAARFAFVRGKAAEAGESGQDRLYLLNFSLQKKKNIKLTKSQRY